MKKLLILTFIASLFLFTSCATNPGSNAGKVNGTVIPTDEFVNSYRGHFSNFSFQAGRSPDVEEKQLIFKETWKNITKYVILKDYYQKYKITANMREVIDTLTTSIPEHILVSPVFMVNDVFNKQLYTQSLLTDRPENLSALRRHYQENLIPILKLKAKLVENELISSAESKQIANILASNADLQLFLFDPSEVKVLISDNEITSYYSKHLANFSLQPYHKLAYSLVPVVPDADDNAISKALADSIYYMLNTGVSAEDIIHSNQGISGILTLVKHGYVKTVDLPLEIRQEFATLRDGACSTVQRSELGWIIHQKVQSTKTLTDYQSIIVQSLARTSTLAAPETLARRMMELALSIGLSEAANEFELPYSASERMAADSLNFSAPDVKGVILKKLRTASSGSILEPIYSSALSAWIVVEVLENQTQNTKSLDQVKDIISAKLTQIRRHELNLQKAESWAATDRLISSTLPPSVALTNASLETVWDNQELSGMYYQAVKAYLAKQDPPAIEHKGILVVPIVHKLSFTKEKVSPAQIRETYVQTLPENWFEKWLNTKVAEAKVYIYNTP
ncbi:MAG: SurA N-terminal domain-containing protein [Candidatus Cloacimonetes bacterium]|nr:SurA N-terminal domain-containing protein [Candidatus Cloacimonadota bacterium]